MLNSMFNWTILFVAQKKKLFYYQLSIIYYVYLIMIFYPTANH